MAQHENEGTATVSKGMSWTKRGVTIADTDVPAAEIAATSSMAAYSSQGDYFTKDEMERFQKPQSQKRLRGAK